VRLLAGDSLTLTPRPQHDEKLHTGIAERCAASRRAEDEELASANRPQVVALIRPPGNTYLLFLITAYTREAGVRSLERHIGSVCRAKAVEYSDALAAGIAERCAASRRAEDEELASANRPQVVALIRRLTRAKRVSAHSSATSVPSAAPRRSSIRRRRINNLVGQSVDDADPPVSISLVFVKARRSEDTLDILARNFDAVAKRVSAHSSATSVPSAAPRRSSIRRRRINNPQRHSLEAALAAGIAERCAASRRAEDEELASANRPQVVALH
jgi:hypothetical protein